MANENITVNMENLTDTERKQLLALVEKANTPESKIWQPALNEFYFTLRDNGGILKDANTRSTIHNLRMSLGNYFRTKEEAEFMINRLKVIQELKTISNGFSPVKEKVKHYYCLVYYFDSKTVGIYDGYGDSCYFQGIYFETDEVAIKAIAAVGEERLKKYYFCI